MEIMKASDNGKASVETQWDETVMCLDEIRAIERRLVELKLSLMTNAATVFSGAPDDDLTFLLMRVGE